MEYERSDSQELTAIWEGFRRGHLTLVEAAQRSRVAVRGNVQVVRSQAAVGDIAPDLLENQESLEAPADSDVLLPSPAITRPEVQTDASLLTIAATDESLMGYRYFLAVADRIRTEKGDYFQQPHRTTIVWGGQKVMFCFVQSLRSFRTLLRHSLRPDRHSAFRRGRLPHLYPGFGEQDLHPHPR